MTTKKDTDFLWCLVFIGSVAFSTQAQQFSVFNPIFRKLIVCNLNNLNNQFDERVLQKRNSWKRTLRSSALDNDPPENNHLEISERDEPEMGKDSWSRPKKEGLWSKLVRYPVDNGDRFRQVRFKM